MNDNQNIHFKEESPTRTEITTTALNELTNTDEENYPKIIRVKDIKRAFITIR